MTVPTFATLLTEYLSRSGISDSELARSIGVRRQTIFRWKEGLVERPRARDDVLRCARKLRLTAEERDLLLLAAGFAPEVASPDDLRQQLADTADTDDKTSGATASVVESVDDLSSADRNVVTDVDLPTDLLRSPTHDTSADDSPHTLSAQLDPDQSADNMQQSAPLSDTVSTMAMNYQVHPTAPTHWLSRYTHLLTLRNSRYLSLGLAIILVILLLVIWRSLPDSPVTPDPVTTNPVVQMTLHVPTPAAGFPVTHPRANNDETLILVAPFEGHTLNERYDVAGRIQEALIEEIAKAKLISTTIEIWPEQVRNITYLSQMFAAADAALIIWGEYDSGRVRVNLDSTGNVEQQRDFALSSPTELITVINTTLPQEIRILALMALGRLLREQNDLAYAESAFSRALALNPTESKTRALLNFYLGHLAEQTGSQSDLGRAIRYYNRALDDNSRLYDAFYNRGTVYLNRSYLHAANDDLIQRDLDAAVEDLTMVIAVKPAYLSAYLNRGVARYERNLGDDLADATDDFSHVIAVDADNWRAYFHRALAAIRNGTSMRWVDDFEQVLALRPNYYPAYNGLCWGYALGPATELALEDCDQAILLDPTGASRDSRGIVYGRLGRNEDAIADFRAYLAWITEEQPDKLYERYRGPIVEEWIALLEQGKNPFSEELLASLR